MQEWEFNSMKMNSNKRSSKDSATMNKVVSTREDSLNSGKTQLGSKVRLLCGDGLRSGDTIGIYIPQNQEPSCSQSTLSSQLPFKLKKLQAGKTMMTLAISKSLKDLEKNSKANPIPINLSPSSQNHPIPSHMVLRTIVQKPWR